MRFLHRHVESFEDVTRNFEQIEQQGIYSGTGAPAFVPSDGKGAVYFRRDTPGTVNQRIYIWSGSAWTGIL